MKRIENDRYVLRLHWTTMAHCITIKVIIHKNI